MFSLASGLVCKGGVLTLPRARFAFEFRHCLNTCNEQNPSERQNVLSLDKKFSPMKAMQDFQSTWEDPTCCRQELCTTFRHDIEYLKSKTNRNYTRTWDECDENICKEKYLCVGDVLPPEVEIRPRRSAPLKSDTGKKQCVGDFTKLGLMNCYPPPPNLDTPCPKVRMPKCRESETIKCTLARPPSCCQKRCTLYPSYSECERPKPKVLPPTECTCTKVPSTCEVYEKFRKFVKK